MKPLTSLGKYHILERLAVDDMTESYKVKTLGIAGFEKVHVLKRIFPDYSSDSGFVKAFVEEAKVAFALNHRNVAQVFEFGRADGELFLAMEYIAGVNLQKVLIEEQAQHKYCPLALACYLMGEVAAGLEYAHRNNDSSGKSLNIIHGDLCPRMIACSLEGSVKILDFGLSRIAWNLVPRKERLKKNVHYLSPEHVRGEPLDARSDVWSFGVILWELLTHSSLFQPTPSINAMIQNIQFAPIPPPRSLNPEIPNVLEDLVLRCLTRKLDERTISASDLHLGLNRIQRTLGAVIGSRALANYLESLVDSHSNTPDVHQEDATPRTHPIIREQPSAYSNDLFNAATELAEPPNPPADPIFDVMPVVKRDSTGSTNKTDSLGNLTDSPKAIRNVEILVASTKLESGSPRIIESLNKAITSGPPRRNSILSDSSLSINNESEMLTSKVGHTPQSKSNKPNALAFYELPTKELIGIKKENRENHVTELPALTTSESEENNSYHENEISTEMLQQASAIVRQSKHRHTVPHLLGGKRHFICVTILLNGLEEALAEAISHLVVLAQKREGLIYESSENKLCVLFGLPFAHEDDLFVAIRFAFEAQNAAANFKISLREEPKQAELSGKNAVQARIGIRSGTARKRGTDKDERFQLLGNVSREAELLAGYAFPGQILLTGTVANLASVYYELQEIQSLSRYGKTIRCHRLTAPRIHSHHRNPLHLMRPIIGRERELHKIQTFWQDVQHQSGQRALLMIGEPGVGKSRLVDEFVQQMGDLPFMAVTAHPHFRDSPYHLLIDILGEIAGCHQSGAGTKSRLKLIENFRQKLDENKEGDLACLQTLDAWLSKLSETTIVKALGAENIQQALRYLLNQLFAQHSLALIIEDLHWADDASLECIKFLLEHPQDAASPLLIILTCRPSDGALPSDHWNEASIVHLLLEDLDQQERQRLIIDELGENATIELIKKIDQRAGGNPYFIRELAQLEREGKNNASLADIPLAIDSIIIGKVDRLPEPTKRVLQYAAVIGPTFCEGILATLMERNPARDLALLRNRGFIIAGLRMVVPSFSKPSHTDQFEREWVFRYGIIQEVIYESLSHMARRNIHRQVSEIMEKRLSRGSNDALSEIARHLDLCGESLRAGEFYLHAAHEAAEAFFYSDALDFYEKALQQLGGDAEAQYTILVGRERIYAQLGKHKQQAADLNALRRLAVGNLQRQIDLGKREAAHFLRSGNFAGARLATDAAEAAAREISDEKSQAAFLLLRSEIDERLGQYESANQLATQSLQLFQQEDDLFGQARAYNTLGWISLTLSQLDKVQAHFQAAQTLAKQLGDQGLERVVHHRLALMYLAHGELAKAYEEAQTGIRICEQCGDKAREGDYAMAFGSIYFELGMYDFAYQYLQDALALERETGSQWYEANALIQMGILEAVFRRFNSALSLLEQADNMATKMGAKYISIKASNASAWVLCERNRAEDAVQAREHADRALAIANDLNLRVSEILSYSRVARANVLLGNLDVAEDYSSKAVKMLTEQPYTELAEEIFYTRFRVLSQMNDSTAFDPLDRAHAVFLSKMARLDRPEWRDSFSENVRLNAAIRRDYLRLKRG